MKIDLFLERLSHPLADRTLAYTEARHRVLVENIANIDTPGYRSRQLDPARFQSALRRALERQKAQGGALRIERDREFHEDAAGRLRVAPALEPADNLLLHDGTNARVEREMTRLAENSMMHQLAVELLNGFYRGIKKAITGRVE